MTRRIVAAALCAAALLPLGGCAVSLFTSSKDGVPKDVCERLDRLEDRTPRIEDRLGP